MAASLSILTGQPKALLKLNLIQPPPKLCGSRRGCPLMIGPGYPKDTRSNFQSLTHAFPSRTILPAVMAGPGGSLPRSFCPAGRQVVFLAARVLTGNFGA